MSLSRLRLITFDLTNTLLQLRSSPGKQYGDLGALFGVRCDNNDLARNYKANWSKMNRKYPNFGRHCKMDWQEWWQQLIGDTFADSGEKIADVRLHDFATHLLDLYKTTICWQHCNGSLELLSYLRMQQQLQSKEKNSKPPFVMGIIANFDPRLETLLRNMKINHFFDFALNSYDSCAEKPSREIFELAIKEAQMKNLQPEECLHIGDGPTTDYLGAKALGWHAVLLHQKSANYLIDKYGDKIEEDHVFSGLYDFHKKFTSNSINW